MWYYTVHHENNVTWNIYIYIFSSTAIYELVCTKYNYLCCIILMVEYIKKVSQQCQNYYIFSKFACGKLSLHGGTTKSFKQRMCHSQQNVWPGTLSIICWRYYLVKIIHFRDKKKSFSWKLYRQLHHILHMPAR